MHSTKNIWKTEGDLKLFESNGLKCAIVRNPEIKHLCGYVELPDGHPWRQIERLTWERPADVHGGITYARVLPALGCFAIGFDCAHAGDYLPGQNGIGSAGVYRTMEYVENERRKLAEQIEAAS